MFHNSQRVSAPHTKFQSNQPDNEFDFWRLNSMDLPACKRYTDPQTSANTVDTSLKRAGHFSACLRQCRLVVGNKCHWSASTMSAAVLVHYAKLRCSPHIADNVRHVNDKEPRMKQQSSQKLHLQHLCSLGKSSRQASKGCSLRTLSSTRMSNTYL